MIKLERPFKSEEEIRDGTYKELTPSNHPTLRNFRPGLFPLVSDLLRMYPSGRPKIDQVYRLHLHQGTRDVSSRYEETNQWLQEQPELPQQGPSDQGQDWKFKFKLALKKNIPVRNFMRRIRESRNNQIQVLKSELGLSDQRQKINQSEIVQHNSRKRLSSESLFYFSNSQ